MSLACLPARAAPPPRMHETAILRPQQARVEPRFGRSVAIAGTAVLVASPNDGDDGTAGGAVHVFGDSKSGWRRVQRLFSVDPASQDRFAQCVAADGSRMVVGRDRADDVGQDAGAVAVFRRNGYHFRLEADLLPSDAAPADGFGGAVAIGAASGGPTIVVGAPRDDGPGVDSGSASVFTFVEGAWRATTKLVAPDAAAGDWFGHAVAVSDSSIAVGAYGDDDRGEKSGAVYLFSLGSEGWRYDAKLAPEDSKQGDWFGFACALDRTTLAIGAPRDDGSGESAGCVRLYRKTTHGWEFESTLRPPPGSPTVWFGYAVALDRGRLLVGAPGDDTDGNDSGVAYLYRRERDAWTLSAVLAPSAPIEGAQFGACVALHDDLAAAGRIWDEDGEQVSGTAWVFRLPHAEGDSRGSRPPRGSDRPSDDQPTAPRRPVAPTTESPAAPRAAPPTPPPTPPPIGAST